MNYYVTIKHPITGGTIDVVPTGQTRTEERSGSTVSQAEAICITPKTGIEKLWFTREEIIINSYGK